MSKPAGRVIVRGDGRQECKHLRRSYTYAYKLAVINHFRNYKSIRATMQFFYPDIEDSTRNSKRKLVYKWENRRQLIEVMASCARLASQCRVREPGLGTTLSREAELAIVKWVNDYRRDGVPVSPTMLQLKAKEVAADCGVSSNAFSGSWHWQCGFTKRHRLSFRTKMRQGQTTPAEATEKAATFAKEVAAKATAEGIQTIYNADQTGVNFELLPRRTLSPRGAKTVWVKCGKRDKERMTAMLLGDSKGNKYPLFLVMKTSRSRVAERAQENNRERHGFGRHVWSKLQPLQDQHSVQIYGNPTAWWSGSLTLEFLRYHFGHRGLFSEPIMLLLDDFSGHWMEEVKEYATMLNIVLMKVPAGMTWLCQPADAVWIKPVKDRLRRYWVEYLQQQIEAHNTGDSSSGFDMTAPSREKVTAWVADAWSDIADTTIRAGFEVCLSRPRPTEPAACELQEPAELQASINSVVEKLSELQMVDTTRNIANSDDVVDNATEPETE